MVDVENNDSKACLDCQEKKPLSDFHNLNGRRGGYPCCKPCRKIRGQKWAEKTKDTRKQWRDENKEIIQQRNKEYYRANRDKELARCKEYRETNREKIAARSRRYLENNRDKCYAHVYKRRARKLSVPNETIIREEVFLRDKGMCGICGGQVDPNNWHMDHIYPISKGGSHTYDNVRVTHPTCNLQKSDKVV